MSVSKFIELPGRFTLPALAELKTVIDKELLAGSAVVLDGNAVTSVDSAALQFILVVQRAVDSRRDSAAGNIRLDENKPHGDAHQLSVLHAPSPTLANALLAHGALSHRTDIPVVSC